LPAKISEYPLSYFQPLVSLVFLVLVCLLQEQEASDQPQNYNSGANNVGQEVGESGENGVGLEESGIIAGRVCEGATETSTDN
jgi:hypothetical protein